MRHLSWCPTSRWLRTVTPASAKADILAGLTNAAVVLPQGVACAVIAGLPPEYGLYTAMVTAIVAALFGSSMMMVSGPTTAMSALVFASLAGFAAPGGERFIQLALLVTVLVGTFQLVAGLARLGGLISFVSHSVITAFTAAAALLIEISQLSGALEVSVPGGGNVIERIIKVAEAIPHAIWPAILIASVTLLTVALIQTYTPKLPEFLIALVMRGAVSALINAEARGRRNDRPDPGCTPLFSAPCTVIRGYCTCSTGSGRHSLGWAT